MAKQSRTRRNDCAVVIERYTLPTVDKPDGELAIIAGKHLLYYGSLPYECGDDGKRVLPFVQQNSITRAGCFYGTCMVERAIPVQRAYNAVKNRKHEFLNRIAMGVLTVEDGSVDTDNLESEGLSPGKVLVYRQGSVAPKLLSPGTVPSDFTVEEQRLLNEFVDVSGISEIMRSSSVPSTVTSGRGDPAARRAGRHAYFGNRRKRSPRDKVDGGDDSSALPSVRRRATAQPVRGRRGGDRTSELVGKRPSVATISGSIPKTR